jgi:hypothetical protein
MACHEGHGALRLDTGVEHLHGGGKVSAVLDFARWVFDEMSAPDANLYNSPVDGHIMS